VINIHAGAALLQEGWAANVRISVEMGRIVRIEINTKPHNGDDSHAYLLPGLDNVHSHAFQRAMSGLTEQRGKGRYEGRHGGGKHGGKQEEQDSFWSWRRLMYIQALAIEPDEMEAIACQLYMEMLEAGFTRVGEFHYLHHGRDGKPYATLSEMARAVASAAQTTGIGLTLLPVFYAHAGFGGMQPQQEQRRFINSLESFARLWQECDDLMATLPNARLGMAAHSLRAVTPSELQNLISLAADKPIHIHIAEQVKEIEDCLAATGARPVQWLMDNAPVGENWTLIHATHMDEKEIAALASSGAIAGLCPITEANLGDGIFPMPSFLAQNGQFAIGSDSNIMISIAQELRQLEYSQRLNLRIRNVIAEAGRSTGQMLYDTALCGGAKSIHGNGSLQVGSRADFITLRAQDWADFSATTLLDQWIFGQGIKVDCVFVAGKKRVDAGCHLDRDMIVPHFARVMRKLRS